MFVTYNDVTYDVFNFYYGSEDWMGYQLEYCNDTDPTTYYVGGIELRPTSSNTFNVYLVDLNDGDFPEHFLFSYEEIADDFDGEYTTLDGGEYESYFMWMLCDACEKFFN